MAALSSPKAGAPPPGPAPKTRLPAYLLVPAITVGFAGVTLFTLAAPTTLVAARVWGGPTGPGTQAVRVECVRRAVGVDDHVPLDGLEVTLAGETTRVDCDDEGSAEVTARVRGPTVPVRVVRLGKVLAEGEARVSRKAWADEAVVFPARFRGGGRLAVQASVSGGALLINRWSRVLLGLPAELSAPGALRITANGADLEPAERAPGGLRVRVRPTFVTATLSLERAGPSGQVAPGADGWEARLPVLSGALVLDDLSEPAGAVSATVRSFSERPRAYVRAEDQRGRVAAAIVRLAPDGRGGSFAPVTLALPDLAPPAWLVVSPDPPGAGSSALSFPLGSQGAAVDGRLTPDRLWVDGLAPLYAEDQRRARRMGYSIGALVAAGALLEALLLLERGRASRRELRAHLALFSDEPGMAGVEEAHGGVRLATAVAAVLFGFAVIGVVLMGRIRF